MNNFWNKHLGSAPQAPTYQPPAPMYQPAPPQQYQQPEQQAQPPRQAIHAQDPGVCPLCASGNYFAPPMGVDSRAGKRCYDCGYPKVQSTSGLTGSSEGKATPARQTAANKSGGFSMTVVGRIG
ncbi:hypothetical protein [Streptomyces sp. NPDC091027]|uniref:hypothetical protein n=1 Tax=Streptomyces sp. NPDC091027 TaxID=3365971 RepID=UPI0038296032